MRKTIEIYAKTLIANAAEIHYRKTLCHIEVEIVKKNAFEMIIHLNYNFISCYYFSSLFIFIFKKTHLQLSKDLHFKYYRISLPNYCVYFKNCMWHYIFRVDIYKYCGNLNTINVRILISNSMVLMAFLLFWDLI